MEGKNVLDNPAVRARVEMFSTRYDSNEAEAEVKDEIREAARQFAMHISVSLSHVDCDQGRLIAALDLIQQAKNVAIDSLILKQAIKKL